MRWGFLKSILIVSLTSAGVARAGSITVDGNDADWQVVQSCFSSGESAGGVTLSRVCIDDDVQAGQGPVDLLFETTAASTDDLYFGTLVDLNGDQQTNWADEYYLFHFPVGSDTADQLEVFTDNNTFPWSTTRDYQAGEACGPGASDTWTAKRVGTVIEVQMSVGCIHADGNLWPPADPCNSQRLMSMGLATEGTQGSQKKGGSPPLLSFSTAQTYDFLQHTLGMPPPPGVVPAPVMVTALAGVARNELFWSNPSPHRGVLITRSIGTPPDWTPTDGQTYAPGPAPVGNKAPPSNTTLLTGNETLDQCTVGASYPTSYLDQNLNAGTQYFYKIFDYAGQRGSTSYSPGVVISATPTSGGTGEPSWCFVTGTSATAQPNVNSGYGIFGGGQVSAVTANRPGSIVLPDGGSTLPGDELFRPVPLHGPVQALFPIVPLHGVSGRTIFVGDEMGWGAAIDASTGRKLWERQYASILQAYPVLRLYDYLSVQDGSGTDYAYLATRNPAGSPQAVYQIDAKTGAIVHTFSAADLGQVRGGMFLDYGNDRLWVTTTQVNGGPNVRVLDAADVSKEVKHYTLGSANITQPPAWNWTDDQILIVDDQGTAYGIANGATLPDAPAWTLALSPTSSYLFFTGEGIIVSRKSGSVQHYEITSGQPDPTPAWSVPIAGPSGVVMDYTAQKVFVSGRDSTGMPEVAQIDFATGALDGAVTLPGAGVSFMPSVNASFQQLYVGTLDGRTCAFPEPFSTQAAALRVTTGSVRAAALPARPRAEPPPKRVGFGPRG